MSERTFAVIGHPIGHTMSPFIHQRLFSLSGSSGQYTVIDIPPEDLKNSMKTLSALTGYNITIPHKQRIIPFLDKIDQKAALYGTVNTVYNRNGSAEGFVTDPDGFLSALAYSGIPLKGKTVILGCGGVARTFAFEAGLSGCDITIAAREEDFSARQLLMRELKEKLHLTNVSVCRMDEIEGEIDLLINATPVGMYPQTEHMPVSRKVIDNSKAVFDAIYNPLHTKLIEAALANGAKAAGGMAMLVGQAVAAHKIWDCSEYQSDDILQHIEDSAKYQQKHFA